MMIQKKQNYNSGKQISIARVWELGNVTTQGHEEAFWDNKNTYFVCGSDDITTNT